MDWIALAEKKPVEFQRVLACRKGTASVIMAEYINGELINLTRGSRLNVSTCTHWMEIPKSVD